MGSNPSVLTMFNEDNTGFINFPNNNNKIACIDSGKTLVYLVAFEQAFQKKNSRMNNINLFSPGIFVSDDIVARPKVDLNKVDIDTLLDSQKEQDNYDSMYFPNISSKEELRRLMSINMISAICVGWSNQSYEFRSDISFWNATFNDLTYQGKNLYYNIKKLHNNKEVRLITFSTN